MLRRRKAYEGNRFKLDVDRQCATRRGLGVLVDRTTMAGGRQATAVYLRSGAEGAVLIIICHLCRPCSPVL